jgi:hypothetical protein
MSGIAILSDAHLLMQAERLRDENCRSPRGEISLINFSNVISQVITARPEAVILAGDMFDEREKGGDWIADSEAAKYWPEIRSQLKRLMECTTHGIYALRGNHDSASVLKELQDYMGSRFHFLRNEEIEILDHRVYFMETHYRQGSYSIPEEELPHKGDILIMHETLPWAMHGTEIHGLDKEVLQELGRRFSLLFNGHMHHYSHGSLDIPNLYSLPALIPSRELKNAFTIKYQWPGDLDRPEVKESPFGYLILDGYETSLHRYSPIQSIVKVEVKGDTPAEVITGINEVYSTLMRRQDKDNLWVWVSAQGVTFADTLQREANKYPEANTMEISVRPKKGLKRTAGLKGLEKMITLSELEAKVLNSLSWPDRDLAQNLFDEIFTGDNLSRRSDSNLGRALFQRLLELAATHYEVPKEQQINFLRTVDPLWKQR